MTSRPEPFPVLERHDARYPERLLHVEDAKALFYRGMLSWLDYPMVAIIGSRDCTEYGAGVTQMLAADLARAGVVVLSGMARGIDSLAHEAALSVGGGTVAVLGTGIDVPYPLSKRRLHDQIGREGLLLTEYTPGTPALPFHFPVRNRLIAGLADVVVVVEAVTNSGTLHTVRAALDMGREVMAVPGPVGRPTSVATNQLIKDGAPMVLSAADVLAELKIDAPGSPPSRSQRLGEDLRAVWTALSCDPVHVDEIASRCGLSAQRALTFLLELEIDGWAKQVAGARFVGTSPY